MGFMDELKKLARPYAEDEDDFDEEYEENLDDEEDEGEDEPEEKPARSPQRTAGRTSRSGSRTRPKNGTGRKRAADQKKARRAKENKTVLAVVLVVVALGLLARAFAMGLV